MEHLEQLAKIVRYAGLNLNPQILSVVLDENVSNLVKRLDAILKKNPDLKLSDVDVIVADIQAAADAANAEAQAKAAKAAKVDKKAAKLDKV